MTRAQFADAFEREGRTGNSDVAFDAGVKAGLIVPVDDQGRPITTIQSDPTEAMNRSGEVQADGEALDDLTGGAKTDEKVTETAPKDTAYGSRINDDYFHLPQETEEYVAQVAKMPAAPDEANMLKQAHTVLQRRRYEVENKVGGYENRGGTDATERVLGAALMKYQRNLREGISGKDGVFKPNEVGQVLNNVIKDFQKGASKRRVNAALDAPTGDEGSARMGDLLPDEAAVNPAEHVANNDAMQQFNHVKASFAQTLSIADRGRLENILERVAMGEQPHTMSLNDINLWDDFNEYAEANFEKPQAGESRDPERATGELPAPAQGDAARTDEDAGGRGEAASQPGNGEPEHGTQEEAASSSQAPSAAGADAPELATGEGALGPEYAPGDRVTHARRAAQVRSVDGDTAMIRYKGAMKDVSVPTSELTAPSRSRFRVASNPAGDMDVIDHIIDEGGIMSRTQAAARGKNLAGAGDYDDAPELKGVYNASIYGGNMMPDQMAMILHDNGVIPEADTSMMWQAISDAIRARADHREAVANEKVNEGQFNRFVRDTSEGKGKKEIPAQRLNVGDTLTIGKEKVKVVKVDPGEDGDVTVQDGRKYGRQEIPGRSSIWVEKFRRGPKDSGNYDDPFADGPATDSSDVPPSQADPAAARSPRSEPEAPAPSSRPIAEAAGTPPVSDQGAADSETGADRPAPEPPANAERQTPPDESASGQGKLPTLRRNENQGDLLSSQSEDLNLVGERGIDHGARQAEQERQAREQEAARAQQERDQMGLFGGDRPASNLKPEHAAALDAALDQTRVAFQRLGFPITEKSGGEGRGMGVLFGGRDGSIMEVNRNQLAENLRPFGDSHEAATRFIRDGINEELRHAADVAEVRGRWEADGRPGDFNDYFHEDKSNLLNDIHGDLSKLSPANRATAEGALLDGWNLYRDGNDAAPKFKTVEELFSHLDNNPGEVANYMAETLRQLTQVREKGLTTETGYRSLVSRFHDFVQNILSRLRKIAQDPKAYSPTLADAIQRLEATMRGADATGETPGGTGKGERLGVAPVPRAAFDPERDLIKTLTGVDAPKPVDPPIDLPSARERITKGVEEAKDQGGKLASAVKELGQLKPLTDKDVALRELSYKKQLNDFYADQVTKGFQRAVPDLSAREAIAVYNDVGGDAAKLRAAASAAKDAGQRARYERALRLSPDEKKVAGALRDFYTAKLDEGQTAGILGEGRENYVNRIVKQPFFELARPGDAPGGAGSSGRFSKRFRFADERTFPTISDVEQSGRKLQTYDAAELAGIYTHELGRAKMTRDFSDRLKVAQASDGRPLAAVRGEAPKLRPGASAAEIDAALQADRSDYVGNEKLGILGNLALHPEAARDVSNVLGTSAISKWLNEASTNPFAALGKSTLRGFQKIQSVTKATMFDLSPFHMTTEGVHAIGHRINPFGSIEKFDPTNPMHAEAARAGLMLVPEVSGVNHFAEGLAGTGDSLVQKIPGVGRFAKGMSDYLFHDYIPSLKLKTYQAAMERNMERFQPLIDAGKYTRQDVAALTADQVNSGYGHLNYIALARNPTMQHVFRLAALAPDFLEARLRFSGQAVKGLAGLAGREQITAMATLFGSQFILARLWNKEMDGDFHWDHPFDLVYKNRTYTLRSVPEDIYKAVTDTGKFLSGRESPALRTGIQLLTGRNYRGERTSAPETVKEAATGAIPISLRELPGLNKLSETQKNATVKWWESVMGAAGFHVGRLTPEMNVYAAANKFKAAQGIKEDTGVYPTSPLTPIKYALQDNDLDRARTELQSLAASGKTRAQIMQSLQASIMHPYTGSKAMDQKFAASLDPSDRAQFQAAQKARAQMLERARALVAALPAMTLVKK